MSGWWMQRAYESGGLVLLFAWVFWVIASIVLHELAHGWAALWQGDDTPRRLDRLTINPLTHMGTTSLLAFALIGIAWGAMPVNPHRFRWRRWGEIAVAAAGPAMNIALALVTLTALALVEGLELFRGGDSDTFQTNLSTFLFIGGFLNLLLFAFNLLPVPPLDGSTILANLVPAVGRLYGHQHGAMIGLFVVVIIMMSGVFGVVSDALERVAMTYVTGVVHLLR